MFVGGLRMNLFRRLISPTARQNYERLAPLISSVVKSEKGFADSFRRFQTTPSIVWLARCALLIHWQLWFDKLLANRLPDRKIRPASSLRKHLILRPAFSLRTPVRERFMQNSQSSKSWPGKRTGGTQTTVFPSTSFWMLTTLTPGGLKSSGLDSIILHTMPKM